MTVVTVKPRKHATHPFDRLFDEFFRTDSPVRTDNGNGYHIRPAVNILETAEFFRIDLAAPGFEKGDFDIKVDKDILTISTTKEPESEAGATFRRREFSNGTIRRSFRLAETIDAGGIDAQYVNGILSLTLPKKEEAKEKPARRVEIA